MGTPAVDSKYPQASRSIQQENVWLSDTGKVVKFSSSGVVLSGSNGFTGGGLHTPSAIALDGQGNAWVANTGSTSVIKMDNNGNILSGASGFPIGGNGTPVGVAIDRAGNVWVGDDNATVTESSNDGTLLSGSTGYSIIGPGGFQTMTVTFDGNGNAWLNTWLNNDNPIGELSPTGVQLSPVSGYTNCVSPGVIGFWIKTCRWWTPDAFALDGAGNVWGEIAFRTAFNGRSPDPTYTFGVAEMSNAGTILSGPLGYVGSTTLESNTIASPGGAQGIAIDGGGNVWMLISNNAVAVFVGAATPVVTPLSVGVKNGMLGMTP